MNLSMKNLITRGCEPTEKLVSTISLAGPRQARMKVTWTACVLENYSTFRSIPKVSFTDTGAGELVYFNGNN